MTTARRDTPAEALGASERTGKGDAPARFDYADYELSLRDRQWNRELLAPLVPHLLHCRAVLDLACGSGVLLELLAERGIPALGVERNARVAAWAREHGWQVACADLFEFLSDSRDTYDGVVCSHVLEHLSFDGVLRLIELVLPRLEAQGTLVLVVPNPESIRMQLFGFWRDPEHVRFYHPELIETVCRHYGLEVVHTNRHEEPFAVPAPPRAPAPEPTPAPATSRTPGWLRTAVRRSYGHLVRALRLVPAADLAQLESRLRSEQEAFERTLTASNDGTTWAVNRMWAWPDNALIVCRKAS